MKEGREDCIWVDRNKENEGGRREERIGYGWTGLKRMEGGEDWIWVDRIEENEGGKRGLDMGGQD